MGPQPKVTVGLMVYNEAKHIERTIQNILQQDFVDFELLIGDNASEDGSSEIIQKQSLDNSRIVHIKRKNNIGALSNWNDLLDRAQGDYFVLAGAHDLWSPGYLRALSETLDENKRAVLAFPKTQAINYQGKEITHPTSIIDTSGMSDLGKFVVLMFTNQHYLYGMMRTAAAKNTRRQLETIGSGEIFLQEIAQLGDFVLVEKQRWYRRENRARESQFDRLTRYQQVLFSNTFTRNRFKFFPHVQMMLHYITLPFVFHGLSLPRRLSMTMVYPLIIVRFIRAIRVDLLWLFK